MDETDKSQQNMISNLPLLFANGYPTSLEKITESQLENFIPFMVQCSLGHINLPKKIDCSEPEWWPENAAFGIPLKKPKDFVGVSMLCKFNLLYPKVTMLIFHKYKVYRDRK